MAKGLTVLELDNIKPAVKRREVPDGYQRGLYFIVEPSGRKSWAFRDRLAGKSLKMRLGDYPQIGPKEARALAAAALVQIAKGIDPRPAKRAPAAPADDLVPAVIDRFLATHGEKLRPSTRYEAGRLLRKELAGWRNKRFSEISPADVHVLLDSIVTRGAPKTANRTLAWGHRLGRWAKSRKLVAVNPFADVERPAVETARDKVLEDSELVAVWRAAETLKAPYCAFVCLLVLTGARRSEIAGMEWSEVDLAEAVWTIPAARAKNKRANIIPLSTEAVKILGALPPAGNFVLSVSSGKNPITSLIDLKRKLDKALPPEMPRWVLHDLRRSFASGLQRLGIGVPVVEKLLGHTSGTFAGVVGVYQRHSYADEKRAAVQAWARHVEMLLSGEMQTNVVKIRGSI